MAIVFTVAEMSCGHCVKSITQAVQQVAPGAQVQADLAAHTVSISDLPDADLPRVKAAMTEAGYTPT